MKRKNLKLGTVLLLIVFIIGSLGNSSVFAAASPYPYAAAYPFGLSSPATDQSAANTMLQNDWNEWKSQNITSTGAGGFKRVGINDTVSEGMGYGMLLAVFFNDQVLFDQLYSYVQLHTNSEGNMMWHIQADGTPFPDGEGSATDGDEDIAAALCIAYKQWPGGGIHSYYNEAVKRVNVLWNHNVEQSTFTLKPGESWGGTNCLNASYFAPAWYRIFADITGNTGWISVADRSYEVVKNIQSLTTTGLIPAWSKADGSPSGGMNYTYQYDSIRYGLRAAIDYCWFGTPEAKTTVDKLAATWNSKGIANIIDGYKIDGTPTGTSHSTAFVATSAVTAMTGTDKTLAQTFYNEAVKTKDKTNTYYGNSLRLQCLLLMTGNMPNIYGTKLVAIKSMANGKYVNAENSGSSSLIASQIQVVSSAKFEMIDLGNGNVALKSKSNGKFVSAWNSGGSPLIACSEHVAKWETFKLIKTSDGKYAFQAAANGKYVCAENSGSSPLIADQIHIETWEKFEIINQ